MVQIFKAQQCLLFYPLLNSPISVKENKAYINVPMHTCMHRHQLKENAQICLPDGAEEVPREMLVKRGSCRLPSAGESQCISEGGNLV